LTLTNNTASDDLPLAPTLTGPGAITSWEINGSLPAGLNFGTSNGTIWGTPTVLQTSPVTYTIWANNSAHSQSFDITLTVVKEEVEEKTNPTTDDGFDWVLCFPCLLILMIMLYVTLIFDKDNIREEELENRRKLKERLQRWWRFGF
jgi:hypothetical protein